MKELNDFQMNEIIGGELTVMAIMTVMLAAVVAVIIYKIFMSEKGASVTLPGGFKFTWD